MGVHFHFYFILILLLFTFIFLLFLIFYLVRYYHFGLFFRSILISLFLLSEATLTEAMNDTLFPNLCSLGESVLISFEVLY